MTEQTNSIVSIVMRDLRSHGLNVKLNDDDTTVLTGPTKSLPAPLLAELITALKGLKVFVIEFLKAERASNETVGQKTD